MPIRLDSEVLIWVQEVAEANDVARAVVVRLAISAGMPFVDERLREMRAAGILVALRERQRNAKSN